MDRQHHNSKAICAMWQALRSFLLADAGAALVEFTLFAPLLIITSIYTMDFGLFFLHQMQAQNAMQAAAQFAMATGYPPSSIDQFTVTGSTDTYCPSTSFPYLAPPSFPCPDGTTPGVYVRVWTVANYQSLVLFPPFSNPNMSFTTQGWVRVQ